MSAQRWVLWGSHPLYADSAPLRLEVGTLVECRSEARYRAGLGDWNLWYRESGKGHA